MKQTGGTYFGGLVVVLSLLPVLAGAANPPEVAPGEPQTALDAPYIVKKGDTLWGISRELLDDPLLWPRLWERNSFISDPNRIYPGDRLNMPGKELAPAPVVEAVPRPEPPIPEPTVPEPVKEPEKPKIVEAPPPPPPAVVAAPRAPEPPLPPASQHARVCSPVLVAEKDAGKVGVGELVRSLDRRVMLSMEDQVVVGMDVGRPLNIGDRLATLRVGRRIIHPYTGASAGRILHVLGIVEVTDVKERVARARVTYSCGPMVIGDRVAPFAPTPFPEDKTPQPTQRSLSAVVLDSLRSEALMGLQQVAFVDLGADHRVAPGDIFAMIRPNAPAVTSGGTMLPMPADRLGDAVVLRVAERSATVLMTASSREIRIGDAAVLSFQIAP